MNKRLLYSLAFLLSMVAFAPSCGDSDPCKDVECGNGTCFEGDCVCDVGYAKDANGQCTLRFIGQYNVSEDCSASAPAAYLITIAEGATASDVTITNFWNLFQNSVKATVDGNNITIARQEPDNDKFFVQGNGVISVDGSGKVVITFTYTVSDETGATPVNDVCTNTRCVKI